MTKRVDAVFDVLTWVAIVFFSSEMIASFYYEKTYRFSLFFFLDLLATITLFFDLSEVQEAIAESLSNDAASTYTTIAQSARVSRSTTKATRILRVVRLVRLFRLLRIFKLYKHVTVVLHRPLSGVSRVWTSKREGGSFSLGLSTRIRSNKSMTTVTPTDRGNMEDESEGYRLNSMEKNGKRQGAIEANWRNNRQVNEQRGSIEANKKDRDVRLRHLCDDDDDDDDVKKGDGVDHTNDTANNGKQQSRMEKTQLSTNNEIGESHRFAAQENVKNVVLMKVVCE